VTRIGQLRNVDWTQISTEEEKTVSGLAARKISPVYDARYHMRQMLRGYTGWQLLKILFVLRVARAAVVLNRILYRMAFGHKLQEHHCLPEILTDWERRVRGW